MFIRSKLRTYALRGDPVEEQHSFRLGLLQHGAAAVRCGYSLVFRCRDQPVILVAVAKHSNEPPGNSTAAAWPRPKSKASRGSLTVGTFCTTRRPVGTFSPSLATFLRSLASFFSVYIAYCIPSASGRHLVVIWAEYKIMRIIFFIIHDTADFAERFDKSSPLSPRCRSLFASLSEMDPNDLHVNKRGDHRGSNGVNAVRGPGGRFVARAPKHALPDCYALVIASKEQDCQQDVLHGKQCEQAAICNQSDRHRGAFEKGRTPAKCPRRDDSARSIEGHNGGTMVLHCNEVEQHHDQPFLAPVRHLNAFSIVTETTSLTNRNYCNVTCAFQDLTSARVLQAFNCRAGGPPLNEMSTFRSHVVYQCALDRRSLGSSLLFVTSLDQPFSLHGFHVERGGLAVKNVVSNANVKKCERLFVSTGLLSGTAAENQSDMSMFSKPPFYMLGATTADGKTVAACVFRVATLNNGHRLIWLELLASKSPRKTRVHGGTAIMQVLRELSMVSPFHPGHVCAMTLLTPDATEFYQRQLPSCNSPQARAFVVSFAFLDTNVAIKHYLDMRCTTVWPNATPA